VLFALNERYFMNEKGAVRIVSTFPLRPDGFEAVVADVLGQPGKSAVQLGRSIEQLDRLVEAVRDLCAAASAGRPAGDERAD
jgi:hypothetical protein